MGGKSWGKETQTLVSDVLNSDYSSENMCPTPGTRLSTLTLRILHHPTPATPAWERKRALV